MPKGCVVCDTVSSGLHFGVAACRACSAFFRRSITMRLQYRCRFNSKCDVTTRNRYSCRSCRFSKCVSEGMIRHDSDPQTPNVELCDSLPTTGLQNPLTPSASPALQESHGSPCSSSAHSTREADFSETSSVRSAFSPAAGFTPRRVPAIVPNEMCKEDNKLNILATSTSEELFLEIQNALKTRIGIYFEQTKPIRSVNYPIPLTLCQQALVAYNEHNSRWPDCTFEKMQHVTKENKLDMDKFIRNYYLECEYVALFCMNIEPFVELSHDQKWIVFKRFWPRFHEIDRCFVATRLLGYDLDDDRSVTYDGFVFGQTSNFSKLQVITDMTEEQIKQHMQKLCHSLRKMFVVPFKKLKANEFEMVYMIMSTLFNLNKQSIKGLTSVTLEMAERMKTRLAEDLHNYYTYELKLSNYAERVHKMSNIVASLDRLQELRHEEMQMSKTFNLFRENIFMSDFFE